MRQAVHNRAMETVCVFDARFAALRGRSRNAAATEKSYTKGKRLTRTWRAHTLPSPLDFSRADGHGRDSFAPNYGMKRRTHDYKRHGTTSLFAALDIATGSLIGKCWPRHRAIEFRKFLHQIDRAVPADLTFHLVLDNYATHKTKEIRAWFLRHPRYHLRFTPTHSSWLNQVERRFALLSQRQIKRGSHYGVRELESAILEFIDVHNEQPQPFVWTKSPDAILNSIRRFASRTLAAHGTNSI